MLKVRNGNYYQQKLQNNYFQPKVLLLAQPLVCNYSRLANSNQTGRKNAGA